MTEQQARSGTLDDLLVIEMSETLTEHQRDSLRAYCADGIHGRKVVILERGARLVRDTSKEAGRIADALERIANAMEAQVWGEDEPTADADDGADSLDG